MIGNGVVIDPQILLKEMDSLRAQGIEVIPDRFKISSIAHVILPYHRLLDSQQEDNRKENHKIGTTGRGIGPAYTDKVSRHGIRMLDLLDKSALAQKIKNRDWQGLIQNLTVSEDDIVEEYYKYGQLLSPFIDDTSLFVHQSVISGKKIVMEGAQGTMLDVDHGTYPFVTSSNPIAGAACMGVGIGPDKIDQVIGVTKAYSTRVGEGPFPTEENGDVADYLREKGCEFGTTTNRPRRCGWLDLVVLKYAIRVNGITEICLTKLDVLDGLKTIKVCTGYETDSGVIQDFPLDPKIFHSAKPIYDEVPGWIEDISSITDYDQLPQNAKNYARYVSKMTGVPISMISVGSRRSQTIHLLEGP